jgi:hypothetical protein
LRPLAIVLLLPLVLMNLAIARADEHGWIDQRIKDLKGEETGAWRRLPWRDSVREALRAASAEGRPLFLFTFEGDLERGRC